MAMYLFLTEYILWNVNNIFCMFISIISSFHILSWLLDGLYNFYRTTIFTWPPYNKQRLRQAVNHKTGLSQRNLAGRFNCYQAYIISKTFAPGYSNPIECRKRDKTPYSASAGKINSTTTVSKTLQSYCRVQGSWLWWMIRIILV